MTYSHTQHAPMYRLINAGGVTLLLIAWFCREEPIAALACVATAFLALLLSYCFRWLTVSDRGDHLAIEYGPLPWFRTSVPYARITGAERGSTTLIDGWGIHWVPFRGWTYNLWGFDCAVVRLGRRVVRIGTDDAENLVAFLRERIAAQP